MDNSKNNSQEEERISRILASRNFEAFKLRYSKKARFSQSLINTIFEILRDEDKFNKFINFGDNVEEFSINGEEIEQSEYLKCMASIFGKKDAESFPFDGYDIPEKDICINRYRKLYDIINLERYANPEYEFRRIAWGSSIRKGDEPDWTVHPEVQQKVYSNMPEVLSSEEKAMWIYLKLCQMFLYDEGYNYKDYINEKEEISSINDFFKIGIVEEGVEEGLESINYTPNFSKKHLEGIVPGAKITCFDFARIFFQMINNLDNNMNAVTIPEGLFEKHFLNGIYSDKISAKLDGVSNQDSDDKMNDLLRVKLGIKIKGLTTIYDPDNILGQAIERLYPLIIGREPMTIEEYREQLREQVNATVGQRNTNNYRFD